MPLPLRARSRAEARTDCSGAARLKSNQDRPSLGADESSVRRFRCLADARSFCQEFFAWYNTEHRRSGIGYMTPHSVHHGTAQAIHATRQATLDGAFLAHPRRFKGKTPQPHSLPTAV
jgi:hypothetical protein